LITSGATAACVVAAGAVLGATALLFFGAFRERQATTEGKVRPLREDLLDVVSDRTGKIWAVGQIGRIVHSEDGGKSWIFQKSGVTTALSAIAFRDSNVGVAVGYDGVILRTTDGGANWTKIPSGVRLYLTSAYVAPGSSMFAAGEFGTILASDDDGATWRIVTSGQYDFIINGIDFSPSGRGWAVGELGKALYSDDAGKTWGPRVITDSLVTNETTLFSVDVVSDADIWVSGLDSLLVHSADGGTSWREVQAPCAAKTQLLRVRFAGQRGYATGRRCVVYSEDGGQSWKPSKLAEKVRYSWIYGIDLTPDAAWMAGYREGLFHAGAGDEWEEIVVDRNAERAPAQYVARTVPVKG